MGPAPVQRSLFRVEAERPRYVAAPRTVSVRSYFGVVIASSESLSCRKRSEVAVFYLKLRGVSSLFSITLFLVREHRFPAPLFLACRFERAFSRQFWRFGNA
jgi:hypothetical protein